MTEFPFGLRVKARLLRQKIYRCAICDHPVLEKQLTGKLLTGWDIKDNGPFFSMHLGASKVCRKCSNIADGVSSALIGLEDEDDMKVAIWQQLLRM